MICGVLKTALYFVGRTLAVLIGSVGVLFPVLAYAGAPGAQGQFLAQYATLSLALLAGIVAHELGHLLACRAVGAEVKAFRLGGRRAVIRFRAGNIQRRTGTPGPSSDTAAPVARIFWCRSLPDGG